MPTPIQQVFAGRSPSEPAVGGWAVTPADSDFADGKVARSLYIGTTGNVKVTYINGDVDTLENVPVGILPICVKRVWAATTASNIHAFI